MINPDSGTGVEQAVSTAHFAGGGRLFFLPPVAKRMRESRSLRSLTKSEMHDSKRHCQQPEVESLTCYQTYRSTPGEAAKLKAHAHAAGIRVSEHTRRRVNGHPEPKAAAPAANLEMYGALQHTTDNINQMTKHANTQAVTGEAAVLDLAQVKALLLKMSIEVAALRADLIGSSKK